MDSYYQLAFVTPGISPFRARARKQRRQIPNLLKKPRGRPQRQQRLRWRHLNFGFFRSFAIFAVVAIYSPYCRKGIPMFLSSAIPSASLLAVVVIEIFIPMVLSTFE